VLLLARSGDCCPAGRVAAIAAAASATLADHDERAERLAAELRAQP
jgi:hypothetical protein